MSRVMIGENMKKYREFEGLTQQQLGVKIGRTALSIRKYENDQMTPSITVLKDVAKALNISVDTLINDEINYYNTEQLLSFARTDYNTKKYAIDLTKIESFDDLRRIIVLCDITIDERLAKLHNIEKYLKEI